MSPMQPDPAQVERIASKLSETMWEYIYFGPYPHWTGTRRALAKRGLLDEDGGFNEVGLAVRTHLAEQSKQGDTK